MFSPTLHIDRSVNRAARVILVSTRLDTFIFTADIPPTSHIKSILQAAASKRNAVEIIVTADNDTRWLSVLNNQKFRQDAAAITCELDAKDAAPRSNNQVKFDEYLESASLQHC